MTGEAAAYETRHHQVAGDPLVEARFASGLTAYVAPKARFSQKYAVLAVHYGSIDSRFVPRGRGEVVEVPAGIAHFLEHKLFEKQEGDVFTRFAELGASANAYTSYTTTAYLFSTVDHFPEALSVLLRFVQEPYFTEASVRKEQGIIEQEIRMYEDDPSRCVMVKLMQSLYHVHPVRLEIGGTVESIRKIEVPVLYLCHSTFYHPANAVLAVAGDVAPDEVFELAGEAMGGSREDGRGVVRLDPEEPAGVHSPRAQTRLAVSRPRLALGIKDVKRELSGKELVRRELAINLALDAVLGRSSDTFQELYEEGLIDDTFAARYVCDSRFAHTVTGGETPDPDRLEGRLKEALARACDQGVEADTVERLRRREIGEFIASVDNPEMIANALTVLHFRGVMPLDYLEVLEELDHRAVTEALRDHVDPARMAVSVVLPNGRNGAETGGASRGGAGGAHWR